MSSRLHFLSIGTKADIRERAEEISRDFGYSHKHLQSISELEHFPFEQVHFILTDLVDSLSILRSRYKDSFILVVVADRENQPNISEYKRQGANHVLRNIEMVHKSRLEYISSQVIRAAYVPVKLSEFPENSNLEFSLYHLMPLNQKLLPILPKGTELSQGRLKKLEGIGEVFVRRDEIDRYRMYVESHPDTSAQGLKSKCRAQYLSLCHAHSQLMFLVTDAEEANTDREAKWLYERCEILGKELLMTLSAVGEAWDVVNNSSIGEVGSVERAPTVAAYAGLISFLGSVGGPVEVIMAALLADTGMLEFHPKLLRKIRTTGSIDQLDSEELSQYQRHPQISLDLCLAKKINLKEPVKNIILQSHERINGSGFPNHKKDKIPMESMLLQFCEMIDFVAMVKMGQVRQEIRGVRQKIMNDLFQHGGIVSEEFLHKVKAVI